ncbi:hypothetical protein ACK4RJ_07825 [Proteus mirabilis]
MSSLLNTYYRANESWQIAITQALPPYIDPVIIRWLETSPDTLVHLTQIYGSPLNIVWPHTVEQNVNAMVEVAKTFGIQTNLYYGVKVNKSQSL